MWSACGASTTVSPWPLTNVNTFTRSRMAGPPQEVRPERLPLVLCYQPAYQGAGGPPGRIAGSRPAAPARNTEWPTWISLHGRRGQELWSCNPPGKTAPADVVQPTGLQPLKQSDLAAG